MRQRTEVRAEIIRPDHQRENPFPKRQVEEPMVKSHPAHHAMPMQVCGSIRIFRVSSPRASVPKIPSAWLRSIVLAAPPGNP